MSRISTISTPPQPELRGVAWAAGGSMTGDPKTASFWNPIVGPSPAAT